MALIPMENYIIKSLSIDTTTTANGNIDLGLAYRTGVPLACKVVTGSGDNTYAIIGRWGTVDSGNWGAKIVKELLTSGSMDVVKSTRVTGTVYYLEL